MGPTAPGSAPLPRTAAEPAQGQVAGALPALAGGAHAPNAAAVASTPQLVELFQQQSHMLQEMLRQQSLLVQHLLGAQQAPASVTPAAATTVPRSIPPAPVLRPRRFTTVTTVLRRTQAATIARVRVMCADAGPAPLGFVWARVRVRPTLGVQLAQPEGMSLLELDVDVPLAVPVAERRRIVAPTHVIDGIMYDLAGDTPGGAHAGAAHPRFHADQPVEFYRHVLPPEMFSAVQFTDPWGARSVLDQAMASFVGTHHCGIVWTGGSVSLTRHTFLAAFLSVFPLEALRDVNLAKRHDARAGERQLTFQHALVQANGLPLPEPAEAAPAERVHRRQRPAAPLRGHGRGGSARGGHRPSPYRPAP
eukprot:jgi/Mesvir1/25127/Mv21585-RA.1